jgi:ankyrin repeat protein
MDEKSIRNLFTEAAGDYPNRRDPYTSQTPLHLVVCNGGLSGYPKRVERLVRLGADVNAKDGKGRTPLHEAAWRGQSGVAQMLIESGANLEARDGWGQTPLHHAASQGFKKTVETLIKGGADVYAADKWGRTAMDVAEDQRGPEGAEAMRKVGLRQEQNRTPKGVRTMAQPRGPSL